MASGHVNRTERPNTWLHRPICNVLETLDNPEPSTHGPSRKRERNRSRRSTGHSWRTAILQEVLRCTTRRSKRSLSMQHIC